MKKRKAVKQAPMMIPKHETPLVRCAWCGLPSKIISWHAREGHAPKPFCDLRDGNSCLDMWIMQQERDWYESKGEKGFRFDYGEGAA